MAKAPLYLLLALILIGCSAQLDETPEPDVCSRAYCAHVRIVTNRPLPEPPIVEGCHVLPDRCAHLFDTLCPGDINPLICKRLP